VQNWRVIALLKKKNKPKAPIEEALVYIGTSSHQVSICYKHAFREIFDDKIKEDILGVIMQKWKGRPDCGRWIDVSKLDIPVIPGKNNIRSAFYSKNGVFENLDFKKNN
jgi:hypothetical protein